MTCTSADIRSASGAHRRRTRTRRAIQTLRASLCKPDGRRSERAHEFGSRDPVERVHHGEPPGHHVYTRNEGVVYRRHPQQRRLFQVHATRLSQLVASLRPTQRDSNPEIFRTSCRTLHPPTGGKATGGSSPTTASERLDQGDLDVRETILHSPIWPRPNSVTVGSRPICKGSATSAW